MKKRRNILLILLVGSILSFAFTANAARVDDVWQLRFGQWIETQWADGRDVLINGLDHYLNFGNDSGDAGYGFRDNSGAMEFKNSGGDWAGIGTGAGAGGASKWATSTVDSTAIHTAGADKIGVGTSTPSVELSVQGNALISGNFTNLGNITSTGDLAIKGTATSTFSGGVSTAGLSSSNGISLTGGFLVINGQAFNDLLGSGLQKSAGQLQTTLGAEINPAEMADADFGDWTCSSGNCTVDADAVALGTDTTGNYAAGDAEAGNALSGDTATAFFSSGTIEHERGGLEADVSAYGNGLYGQNASNVTIDIDTEAELETAIGSPNLIVATEIDTFSELDAIVADKSLAKLEDGQTFSGLKAFSNSGTTTFTGGITSGGFETSEGLTITGGALNLNSENFTDLTGTGLQNTNGTLQTTLGAEINPSEMTDADFGDWTCLTGNCTIDANAVALGTDTTGAYVATIADAGNSTITVTGSGGETAAVTLDAVDLNCTDCLNATELEDLWIFNNADDTTSGRLTATGGLNASSSVAIGGITTIEHLDESQLRLLRANGNGASLLANGTQGALWLTANSYRADGQWIPENTSNSIWLATLEPGVDNFIIYRAGAGQNPATDINTLLTLNQFGDLSIAGSATTTALAATSSLNVAKLSTLQGGFVAQASSTVTGDLKVSDGSILASSTLAVDGLSTLNSVIANASSTVVGDFTTTASTTLKGGFLSSASSTIRENLTVVQDDGTNNADIIIDNGTSQGVFRIQSSNDNFRIGTLTDNSGEFITNNTFRAKFMNTGEFGIATSTPSEQFAVQGNALISGTSTQGVSHSTSTVITKDLSVTGSASTTGSHHISGGVIIQASSTVTGKFTMDGATRTNGQADFFGAAVHVGTLETQDQVDHGARLNINSTAFASASLGTPSGQGLEPACFDDTTYELLRNTGGFADCSGSSERFKENIAPYTGGLDKAKQLDPKTFNFKNARNKEQHIGLMAEDVVQVEPIAVVFEPNSTTTKGVKYDEIIGILINAVKELDTRLARIEKKLNLR